MKQIFEQLNYSQSLPKELEKQLKLAEEYSNRKILCPTVLLSELLNGSCRQKAIDARYLLHQSPDVTSEERLKISLLIRWQEVIPEIVKARDDLLDCFVYRLENNVDTMALYELEEIRYNTTDDDRDKAFHERFLEQVPSTPEDWFSLEMLIDSVVFVSFNEAQYAWEEVRRRRMMGMLHNEEQAYNFCQSIADEQRTNRCEVIIPIGPPGSGKSTLMEELSDYQIISSDKMREKLYGNESIQGNPTKVFGECDRLLEQYLSEGRKIVYDATNTKAKLRRKLVKKCLDYSARVVYYAFDISKEELKRRNKMRERQVPEEVIDRQCGYFDWPQAEECHRIEVVT